MKNVQNLTFGFLSNKLSEIYWNVYNDDATPDYGHLTQAKTIGEFLLNDVYNKNNNKL